MTNIVREFDTPIDTTAAQVPTRPATAADGTVLVEDSITHQAGDGITAGMSPSLETPDIFDNSPQAAIKPQTADQKLVDVAEIPVEPVKAVDSTVQAQGLGSQKVSAATSFEQKVEGANKIVPHLDTLPDGSVDISRD